MMVLAFAGQERSLACTSLYVVVKCLKVIHIETCREAISNPGLSNEVIMFNVYCSRAECFPDNLLCSPIYNWLYAKATIVMWPPRWQLMHDCLLKVLPTICLGTAKRSWLWIFPSECQPFSFYLSFLTRLKTLLINGMKNSAKFK